jgi:hypothetical protein
VPENVAGVDTVDIVKQIRCETREGLTDLIKEKLADWATRGSGEAAALLRKYETDPEAISDFHPRLFPGPSYVEVRRLINLFAGTAIAYTFDLTMTENNDLSTSINLLKALTTPKFTLGIEAGAKRSRENERTFTIADTFGGLVTQLNRLNRYGERYCDGKVVWKNYVYPIAGRIGVKKTIKTFIELTVFENLAAGKDDKKGPPTMTDNLTFITAVNLSATPKIEFTPVTAAFQLADASLTASVVRTDKHQVTIGLAVAGSGAGEVGALRSFAFSPDRGATYRGDRVTGGRTPAERAAVEAIDQVKRRELRLVLPQ